MLAVLGFATLISFMIVVMRRWATAFVAIIAAPIVFAIIAGRGLDLPDMMEVGLETTAPTAALLLFAVLYFGLMMDLKLFDPMTNFILRVSKGDPLRIVVGTAVVALAVALDGDGTTTYMIVCSAFIPLYRRLGMNPLVIAVLATMSLGLISGSTPWGGAATRAISVMHLDAGDYFVPLIPSLALTAVCILLVAVVLGLRERRRVDADKIVELAAELRAGSTGSGGVATLLGGGGAGTGTTTGPGGTAGATAAPARLGWRYWFNLALTVVLLTLLVLDLAPLVILFMVAFVIALLVNVPTRHEQGELIKTHGANAVPVVILVLAAGIFTGILSETGMITAMAESLLSVVPDSLGALVPLFTALIGIPLSFFMSNDAYFFGILPVLAESASSYGIHPMEIARAGVVGQMAHMIGPASAPLWVLLGLLKKELGDFQRFAFGWVLLMSLVFTGFCVLTGAISIPL
ncbi:CitMHS family transporter [Kineococcus sp. SYSU DK001]|uniref:CitMHS family transporter n=1 Tax=Kineococcus sp. SYSU DK001 TaxID=3383122 RepID=UPI003D7DC216